MLAPIENVDKKTLYVADESPVDLCDFANQIQEELGVRKIRHMPLLLALLFNWKFLLMTSGKW